jgi:hypothetical protein
MYTLRIIDQTKVGGETKTNTFLGNEYSVIMNKFLRDDNSPEKEHCNIFKKAIKSFYGAEEGDEYPLDETIVGFVYANNKTYTIHSYQAVYIVNNEGQTFERLYGIYNRN